MKQLMSQLGKRILFFDGAMGTLLQREGLAPGQAPESWNLTHPDTIRAIHRDYLRAGCDIVKANTFGGNPLKLAEAGLCPAEVVTAGVRLAREAVEAEGHGWVALDMGPTGRLLQPMGDLSFDEAVEAYAQMVRDGVAAGADCCLIETMSDTLETKAAVLAAKENCDLPVFVTLTFDQRGRLLTGADIPAAVAMLEGLGVDALGLNCGFGPEQMLPLVEELTRWASVPLIVNPNAGLPVVVDGTTCYQVEPEEFASWMEQLIARGVWMAGGCCGTTPAHLAALTARCREMKPLALPDNRRTVVSSGAMAVVMGEDPVVIGERINPTGKSRLKQALREGNLDYILSEGVKQQQNGAHILDVNVGLPEIDEPAMMEQVVRELQGVVPLPLQIDTSSPAAMEAALRRYNGKAMINSVNGRAESMDAILPLAKKYGGVVVALTMDEKGIPETADGRVAIARRILDRALALGLRKEDLVVDALTMTVSAEQESARVTLETVRRIKAELGLRTVLGVSNISFGLPRRELLGSSFFLLALEAGLDAAIINPGSAAMMDALAAYRALSGLDTQCGGYIARCAAQAEAQAAAPVQAAQPVRTAAVAAPDALSLGELAAAVEQGRKEDAARLAAEELKALPPLELIDRQLIPALDRVGKGFEQGRVFLPQLLMSADAARAAFEVVQEALSRSGDRRQGGKVVLATVQGDIHDIGKNIVKVLLENYGFQVLDLGRDVPPERVVETVLAEDVKLVGLSALMTTTVPAMAETIRQLRQAAPDCRVMVGGAVMTPEYAAQIGADHYGPDAMSSVHYAQELLG